MVGITPSPASDEDIKQDIRDGMTMRDVLKKHKIGSGRAYKLKREAQRHGVDPEYELNRPVPDGWKLKGISDMRTNPEGKPIWYKFDEDKERQAELMRQSIETFREDIHRAEPTPPPDSTISELANTYVLTDYHLGMMSWHEETGQDWDLKTAESLLMAWAGAAMSLAPNARVGILANIGDFLHFDGLESVTPEHRNVLDSDTRLQKMVRVAIRCIRRIVAAMLEKHEYVHVLMCDANHDPSGESWMREWMDAHYEDDPRVSIDLAPQSYYCYEHGDVSLFFHHGHKRKINNIDDVFVSKFREVFGRTKFSYAHLGHLHNDAKLETNLMILERHRTLAARDAYAAQNGYMSGRDAKVITYHKQYGEVSRLTITPEMLG